MNTQLKQLCDELGFEPEATAALLSASETDEESVKKLTEGLVSRERFPESTTELLARYESDKTGWCVLKIMLIAALRSREIYRERGISDEIFLDTMKCFPRFVREHRASFGTFGFDRGFWVGRQLSLVLFRIGELEYELSEHEGKNAISVHIPSDADLTPALLDGSFAAAKDFFARYFPDYANAHYFCYSWLISPALKNLLPANSKIILFQNRFRVLSFDEKADNYKLSVFKNKELSPQGFPEITSLQRRMKAHVLKGGTVGEALGILV